MATDFKLDECMERDLQELGDILASFSEINRLRAMDAEDALNEFIESGTIQPLNEKEGLFLITKVQLDAFYANIKEFNKRVDTTVARMNQFEVSTRSVYGQLESTRFSLKQSLTQKQRLEEIIKDLQQTRSSISNPIDLKQQSYVQQQQIGTGKAYSKEHQLEFLNDQTRIVKEQQQYIAKLEEEVKMRNEVIAQLESRMDIEIEQNNAKVVHILSDERGCSDANSSISGIMQQRIDELEKQVASFESAQGVSFEKLQFIVSEKVRQMGDEIERNKLLFAEEDSDDGECDSSSFTQNIVKSSNSRGLYVMGLQKELNYAQEQLRDVTKAFAEYKDSKEAIIAQLSAQKVDVSAYQKQLEGLIQSLEARLKKHLTESVELMDLLRLHQDEMNSLKSEKSELIARLEGLEVEKQVAVQEVSTKVIRLQEELEMKCDIIRKFDPSSCIFAEQRTLVETQVETIRGLTEELEGQKASERAKVGMLNERIATLEEQKKILTCIVGERNAMVADNTRMDVSDSHEADQAEKEFYKKKYEEIDLKYGMLVAQNDADKRRLVVENAKLKQQIKQVQAISKNKRVAERLTVSENISGSGSGIGGYGYQPLSEELQKLIEQNQEQKNEIQKLNVSIAALDQQNKQMRAIIVNLGTSDSPNQPEVVEQLQNFDSLNEHLFLIQTLTHSTILKEL